MSKCHFCTRERTNRNDFCLFYFAFKHACNLCGAGIDNNNTTRSQALSSARTRPASHATERPGTGWSRVSLILGDVQNFLFITRAICGSRV